MSVIQRAMQLAQQFQSQSDFKSHDDDIWNKRKNDAYFGHHAPIKTFIPTEYAPLDHIVEHSGVPIMYASVESPVTETDWERKLTNITMPHPDTFTKPEFYAAVLMHELTHSTQVKVKRPLVLNDLNMPIILQIMGAPMYGRYKEEMVAEWTSYRLMEMVGVDTESEAAYYMASKLRFIPDEIKHDVIKEVQQYSDQAFKYLVNLGV